MINKPFRFAEVTLAELIISRVKQWMKMRQNRNFPLFIQIKVIKILNKKYFKVKDISGLNRLTICRYKIVLIEWNLTFKNRLKTN